MSSLDADALVDELDRALRAVAVVDDAAPMQRYMKDHFPFLGVKSKARRTAAKPVMAQLRGTDVDTLLAFAG